MKTSRFFIPFVGKYYAKGIKGKKILVVAASFYCKYQECHHFVKCTDVGAKDSSPFDAICPIYQSEGKYLHNEPLYCIENLPETYTRFAAGVAQELGVDSNDVWDYVAFTNYVQFFLPCLGTFRETRPADLSCRDLEAFIETLKELRPDIVIIWGSTINQPIKKWCAVSTESPDFEASEGYLWSLISSDAGKEIIFVNPYHPASGSAWYSNLKKFQKYLSQALDS